MKPWAKAAVQGAACGLVLGLVLLAGGRVWQPQAAAAQAKELPPIPKDFFKQQAVAEVVKARRFEVVDEAGKQGATLDASGLVLYAQGGKQAAVLNISGLSLIDTAGERWASLGYSGLNFLGSGWSMWVRLDTSGLNLFSTAGNASATLGFTPEGSPRLALSDRNGKLRAVLGATSLETIRTAEVTMRPESSLVLFDKDGKVMWQAP